MTGNLAAVLLLLLIMENPLSASRRSHFRCDERKRCKCRNPSRSVAKSCHCGDKSGSTIVFRAGVYYEVDLGSVTKKIILQAYPHEQVYFLGSKPATGWTKEKTYWRTAWTNPLTSQNKANEGRNCPKDAIDPAYPNACLPEQVFVAGKPLAQVTSIAEVVAGKFFMDSANKVLYIGTDPTSKLVEVSTLLRGLQFAPGAEGSKVLGIGIAHYSSYWGDNSAAVLSYCANITIDLCSFVQNAAMGLKMARENLIIRSSVFSYNGMTGFGCNRCHNSLFEWNYISFNNQERFATSKCGGYCTVAGMKVAHVDRLTVNMNNFYRNNAGGLWFDLGCTNAMVTRNLFQENGDGVAMISGLFVEVSSTATVASNAFIKNLGNGIQISGSDRTRVYNNNFVQNKVAITMKDDSRKPCEFETYSCDLKLTWDTTDTVVRNNLISNSLLCPTSECTRYKTHTDFMQATNLDWAPPSIGVRDTPNNPFFVDEANNKLSLKSDSSARSAGTALPADIAAYLGVKASPVDMGALTYRDKKV
ncbi:right handed beta helix region domain-containing protein [Ditylenchus destructor]|nr:right handed beta helix region domain-containing protein [Ditylenchus destructor]